MQYIHLTLNKLLLTSYETQELMSRSRVLVIFQLVLVVTCVTTTLTVAPVSATTSTLSTSVEVF